jgi:hypothetical protein
LILTLPPKSQAGSVKEGEAVIETFVARASHNRLIQYNVPFLVLIKGDVRMAFTIDIQFLGGLSQTQQDAFVGAATRWQEIITGDLPRVRLLPQNTIVEGVLITAAGVRIDGLGDPVTGRNVLGQAAPLAFRPGSQLPAFGFMEFDTADLLRMELDGSLQNVIIHEMGHVLGIGTIWDRKGLLEGAGSPNPVFDGEHASREYSDLAGFEQSTPIPVANRGGPGSRDGHWREAVFVNELMSPLLNAGANPISRFTIASLSDLGYGVNLDAADPYEPPSAMELAILGAGADDEVCRRCSRCGSPGRLPEPNVLSEDALCD